MPPTYRIGDVYLQYGFRHQIVSITEADVFVTYNGTAMPPVSRRMFEATLPRAKLVQRDGVVLTDDLEDF